MRLAIGTGMVDAALVAKDFYNAVNLNPDYVADFQNSYYRVDKVPSTFSSALNFARTGTATYTDATGTLQTAADGVPRLDHHIWNGSAWVKEMFKESDAATNLLTYSEQFDNGVWAKTNATVTANAATAPDGTLTADKLIGTGSNPFMAQSLGGADTSSRTISVYAKASDLHWLRITNASAGNAAAWFNLADGVIGTVSGSASPTAGIVELSNGWYRCFITLPSFTPTTTATVLACTDADGALASYTGDGTSGIFIWGAQLEAGSTPTSYIKTEATTATRNAETLTASAGNLPEYQTVSGMQLLRSTTWLAGFIDSGIKGAFLSDTDATDLVGGTDNDRSVNANPLTVNGTITRTPVATGADLVAYSGFSASNYLEQPYNADLDFGTGDFCVMGWVKDAITAAGFDVWVESRDAASTEGFVIGKLSSGEVTVATYASGVGSGLISTQIVSDGNWHHVAWKVSSSGTVFDIFVDGVLDATSTVTARSIGGTDAPLLIGQSRTLSGEFWTGSLALIRISATAPTAEQIAKIYEKEAPLFAENATLDVVRQDQVSIQMEGTMSYADSNSFAELEFLNWELDTDNKILFRLRTSLGSGDVLFYQEAADIADFVASNANTYTPGINVPFNIASRHGSTFINGAVDGTALTADTTPTALPDLSTTDLEIAPTFNGTIKLLRIWGSDIGDTGIAQASA